MRTKFKKLTSVCLAVIMILSVLTVAPFTAGAAETDSAGIGDTYTSGDYEYKVLDDGTASITRYNGSATELEIPSILGVYTVTEIGDYAFSWCESITSVEMPNSIYSIGESCFAYCHNLNEVKISNNVKEIKNGTFLWCDSLTKIELPNVLEAIFGCEYYAGNVYGAFSNCKQLTEIVLPQSLKYLKGNFIFSNCEHLKKVVIPNGVMEIGSSVFENCRELEDIIIPESIESIDIRAFSGCSNLKKVYFNAINCKYINESIMYSPFSMSDLIDTVIIGDDVETIDGLMFINCKNLKEITIPQNVVSIGNRAFGYYYDGENDIAISDFTIKGYKNTAAEIYANENGFTFIALDSQQIGDVDGDGKISIDDVTDIQKHLANMVEFTKEQVSLADVDKNGTVSIDDVTLIQKHLAGLAIIE